MQRTRRVSQGCADARIQCGKVRRRANQDEHDVRDSQQLRLISIRDLDDGRLAKLPLSDPDGEDLPGRHDDLLGVMAQVPRCAPGHDFGGDDESEDERWDEGGEESRIGLDACPRWLQTRSSKEVDENP